MRFVVPWFIVPGLTHSKQYSLSLADRDKAHAVQRIVLVTKVIVVERAETTVSPRFLRSRIVHCYGRRNQSRFMDENQARTLFARNDRFREKSPVKARSRKRSVKPPIWKA